MLTLRVKELRAIRCYGNSLLHFILRVTCDSTRDRIVSLTDEVPPPADVPALTRTISVFGTPKKITSEDGDNLIDIVLSKIIQEVNVCASKLIEVEKEELKNLKNPNCQLDFFEIESTIYQSLFFLLSLVLQSSAARVQMSSNVSLKALFMLLDAGVPRIEALVIQILAKVLPEVSPDSDVWVDGFIHRLLRKIGEAVKLDAKGNFFLNYICNFYVLNHLLLIYICKLHWM